MPIIFGVASTLSVILISTLITSLFGFYIHSFSFFFIIPVGAILAGAGCCYGLLWGLSHSKKDTNYFYFFVAILLGITGFIGIYYALYSSTFVTPDMKINHAFNGEHISNFYYKDTGKPVSFLSYLDDAINNGETTMFVGGKRRAKIPVGSFEMANSISQLKFFLQGLGFVVGSVLLLAGEPIERKENDSPISRNRID